MRPCNSPSQRPGQSWLTHPLLMRTCAIHHPRTVPQTDVIESNYKVLEERIQAAHDFSEAERAHHLYLHNLMDQSFLTSKTICTLISTVFGHVQVGNDAAR